MKKGLKIVGWSLVTLLFLAWVSSLYSPYMEKKHVGEAVKLAESVRDRIGQFYTEQKRLPAASEAAQFRTEGGEAKFTKLIIYDAESKMIVVTAAYGQFGIRAEEKGGALSWTCRTISIPERMFPTTCR